MYLKLKHPERPFVLHVFVSEEVHLVSRKLNRIKTIKEKFDPNYFELHDNEDAAVFDLEDSLPAHYVMILRKKPYIGDIVHESFHAVAKHFNYIGTPLTPETEEQFAYFISWIVESIDRWLKAAKS
jgi:hypothetical protein